MKRFFLFIAVVFTSIGMINAQSTKITKKSGDIISGYYINSTDTTISIRFQVDKGGHFEYDTMLVNISDVYNVRIGNKEIIPEDGKLSYEKSVKNGRSKYLEWKFLEENTNKTQIYPNVVIGQAFKTAGGVSIGVGVPCLALGTIFLVAGTSSSDSSNINTILAKSRLATAGCVILPIGASLTIVGIPLFVNGKRIMNMNFNLTGNGAGVALQF